MLNYRQHRQKCIFVLQLSGLQRKYGRPLRVKFWSNSASVCRDTAGHKDHTWAVYLRNMSFMRTEQLLPTRNRAIFPRISFKLFVSYSKLDLNDQILHMSFQFLAPHLCYLCEFRIVATLHYIRIYIAL